jgi:hypothetical protein
MFSVKELIDEIEEITNTSCHDRAKILKQLNKSLRFVASVEDLYLPDLLVYKRSINSFGGRGYCALPSDFHKKIVSVRINNLPVKVHDSVASLRKAYEGILDDSGEILGVAAQGQKLFYQQVPVDQINIYLSYYRRPEELSDASGSFPEGITGVEQFDECLTAHASWKIYSKIEDGMEGQKVNTMYYKNEFYENLESLRNFCTRDAGPDATEPGSDPFQLFND